VVPISGDGNSGTMPDQWEHGEDRAGVTIGRCWGLVMGKGSGHSGMCFCGWLGRCTFAMGKGHALGTINQH